MFAKGVFASTHAPMRRFTVIVSEEERLRYQKGLRVLVCRHEAVTVFALV